MTSVTLRLLPAAAVALAALSGCSMFRGDDDNYGLKRRSDEWYAIEADRPVGSRQKLRHGKLWPPYPRPTGEQQEFSHRYHHAHYWPLPYVCYDRMAVRDVMQMQVVNGWTTQTTLYDYHFDADTHELNQPGWLHLQWILQDVPPQYRVVWVQATVDAALSQQRLNAVRLAAAEMSSPGHVPSVSLRVGSPPSRPADEVDRQNRAYINSMPDPRLPNVAVGGIGG